MTHSTQQKKKPQPCKKPSPEEIAWEHAPEQRARRHRGLRAGLAAYLKGGEPAVREYLAKVRAARQNNGEAGVDQYLDQLHSQAQTDQTSNVTRSSNESRD